MKTKKKMKGHEEIKSPYLTLAIHGLCDVKPVVYEVTKVS